MTLNKQQRETINHLVGCMMAANNATPYDRIGYDAYSKAVYAFLISLIGQELFDEIDYNWNWGGSNTYADDAQTTIEEYEYERAMEERRAEEHRDLELWLR